MRYDDIERIPGIYPLETFSDISVPVTYPSGYGMAIHHMSSIMILL